MIRRQGHVATPEASRVLQRLCYHFSRKIAVRYDEHQGEAEFPWGRCTLTADARHLRFDCRAGDAEQLARVQGAIDSHIELFSRKAPLRVDWQAIDGPAPDAA